MWWGWVCARRSAGENPPPKIKAALDATEKWIAQPSEDNRRSAMAAAQKAELGTAAGCAGLAAFFSGGSLAPPDAPLVPPGEGFVCPGSRMQQFKRDPYEKYENYENCAPEPPWELVALELAAAIHELGEITGEEVGEAILDRIFGQFCLGK